MATIQTPPIDLDPYALPPEPVRRWTVAEYHELIRLGVLQQDDPYELIEGWLVLKMTKNPAHEFAVEYLNRFLQAHLPNEWRCRCQQSITLTDGQPEPDIAIVRGLASRQRHPIASEVVLVIEVADTSVHRDRTIKLRSYARAMIPEYWIVNLETSTVEVYRRPTTEGSYTQTQLFRSGEVVAVELDGNTCTQLSVRSLFEE